MKLKPFYLKRLKNDISEPNKFIGEGIVFSNGQIVVRFLGVSKIQKYENLSEFSQVLHNNAEMVDPTQYSINDLGELIQFQPIPEMESQSVKYFYSSKSLAQPITEITIEFFQSFVDIYNSGVEKGRSKVDFFYIIQCENSQSLSERSFNPESFKIKLNPDLKRVENIMKSENKFIKSERFNFCPCKIEHIPENICPCKNCIEEIAKNNHCHCQLYFKA